MEKMTITGYIFLKEDYEVRDKGVTTTATTDTCEDPPTYYIEPVLPNSITVPAKEESVYPNPHKYRLYITDEFMIYHYNRSNWWVRMWQRLLLGMRWEKSNNVN